MARPVSTKNTPALRSVTGRNRPSDITSAEKVSPKGPSEMPRWAKGDGEAYDDYLAVFTRVCRSLRSLDEDTPVDNDALNHYCLLVVQSDRLAKVLLNSPIVIRDANGMPAVNPLQDKYMRVVDAMVRLGSKFGLAGPVSRMTTNPIVNIAMSPQTSRLLA